MASTAPLVCWGWDANNNGLRNEWKEGSIEEKSRSLAMRKGRWEVERVFLPFFFLFKIAETLEDVAVVSSPAKSRNTANARQGQVPEDVQ